MTFKAIRIDLRRDLPKARAMFSVLLLNQEKCLYASPCVVGAMMPEDRRDEMDHLDIDELGINGCGIDDLLKAGIVKAPKHQWDDLIRLQRTFDRPKIEGPFETVFAEIEAKYAQAEGR